MKEEKNLLNFKNRILLCLVAGFIALMALGVRTYAADNNAVLAGYFEYNGQQIPYYYLNYIERLNYEFQNSTVFFESDKPLYVLFLECGGDPYLVYASLEPYSYNWYYNEGASIFDYGSYEEFDIGGVTVYSLAHGRYDYEFSYPLTSVDSGENCWSAFKYYLASPEFEPYEPEVEIPDMDSLEKNYDFYLKDFTCDNSITATWDGTVTNEYENDVSYVVAYLGYAFKEQPAQIAVRELYNGKALITDNSFYIPWDEVQHVDDNLYLRYVEFVPYGKLNPDKVFLPYIKGNSSFIYFSVDASGAVDKIKVPTFVDNNSFTTNIPNGVFDSSIPALSDIERINNGFADPLSSYSQSVTFKWSTVFDDPNYYIQVRTTFRYKLNVDKVWEEITIDTSVPTGRYSCLVDNSSFTYTYGDYGPLFWQQDDSIWTDDSLDKHGNLQPVRDSIRVVHVADGYVSYGPWTTFTLKNGMWWHGTGEITGSYESDILEEDNTGGSIVEDGEVNSNFLTDFDFTDISGVWNTFIGIFKNLFSFLGQFPDLFSQIFSFLPYEIRSMFYVSMAAICVLGLVRAVIK